MTDYAALATEVMEHAIAFYDDGWDYVVDHLTREGIAAKLAVRQINTRAHAIAYYSELVDRWIDVN